MAKVLHIIPAGLVALIAIGAAASAAEHQVPVQMAQAQIVTPAGAPKVVNPPLGPKAAKADDDDDDSEENDVFDPNRPRNPVAPVEQNSANEIDRGS